MICNVFRKNDKNMLYILQTMDLVTCMLSCCIHLACSSFKNLV